MSKALGSGPVPADPAIRQAALLPGERALIPATRSARLLVAVSVLNALVQHLLEARVQLLRDYSQATADLS